MPKPLCGECRGPQPWDGRSFRTAGLGQSQDSSFSFAWVWLCLLFTSLCFGPMPTVFLLVWCVLVIDDVIKYDNTHRTQSPRAFSYSASSPCNFARFSF